MNFYQYSTFVLCVLIASAFPATIKPATAANPPTILVTIKPVHSLLAAVTEGVFEPQLLLDGVSSPHHFQLKPSAVKLIYQSDHVFWISEGLESFLIKTLNGVTDKTKAIKLIDVPGLTLLPLREKDFHDHDHGHDSAHDSAHDSESDTPEEEGAVHSFPDSHFWLDPFNASVLATYFADTLAGIDPANTDTYQANAALLQIRLQELNEELSVLLADSHDKPYLVFHDSFQYFEKRFNLNSAGVISIQPDAQPSAQRIRELQQLIRNESVHCLFSEPQYQSRSVQMLVADTAINHAMVDPLGSAVPAGVAMYATWLKNTALAISGCLNE